MKLLFLVNHFAEYGGIQRMLNHKILALKHYENCEIVLVTRFQNNRAYLYDSHHLTKQYDLNLDSQKTIFSTIATLYRFKKRMSAIIEVENPDVVITTLTSYYSLILPFIKRRTPKLIEFHSTASTMQSGQWRFKKMFYKLYDNVVVLNEEEKRNYDLNNTIVIPNFIHEENAIPYPKFTQRSNTIVAAGRVEPVKQFDHLILAWSQIAEKHPDWKVAIYGDGNERARLEKMIQEHKVSASIQFMGTTNRLSEIMQESALYCMTSKTDCFPMVLLEAKQAGLPIVSYDCPYGPKHIVKDGEDGLLIAKDDFNELSSALGELISNSDKRRQMSEKAYGNFSEFSSERVIFLWINLFKKLQAKS